MQTGMIRTTVTMPAWLHKKLKLKATKQNKSVSRLILESRIENFKLKSDKINWKFFDKVAKSGPQFDTAEVVRKERDGRTKKYE
ncbi:hypothetical protein KJ909_00195 [Patescibacteria group bacterium]|nr:hypothetical protein [Patescibacteria group bacterium]